MKLFKTYPPLTYVILFTILFLCIYIIISRIHFNMGVAELIDGIESYQGIKECRSFFTSQGYSWKVTYKDKVRDGEEPIEYWVQIKNYRSMGIPGMLILEFFKGQLCRMIFYPSDFDYYLKKLKGKRIADFFRSPQNWISSRTRVRIVRRDDEPPHIVWVDARLEKEILDWMYKHVK